MKKKLIHYFFTLLIAAFLYAPVYTQTHIGYVADISGNWSLNNSGSLKHGQKLPPSAKISSTNRGENNYIKIADLTGKVREYKRCSQPCSFQLPAAASSNSYFSTILSSVMDLVWGSSPERFSEHRSKRINVTDAAVKSRRNTFDLPDGVLKLENEKIYLPKPEALPGELQLKLRKVISGNKSKYGKWSKNITAGTEDGRIVIPFSALKPGLYEFCMASEVQKRGKDKSCLTNSTWIYISSPENHEQIKKEFEEIRQAINSLTQPTFSADNKKDIPGIDLDTASLYLRIYLESLDKKFSVGRSKN